MRFLISLYLLFSILFPIEYIILYDQALNNQALTISDLYTNQVNDEFKLETAIYSNEYIDDNYLDNNFADKIKSFITDEINNNSDLKYILILGDENSFPPIYMLNNIPSDDFYAQTNNDINTPPQLSIGRIPSSDINEITQFVNKVESFLLNPTIGAWRDKAMLIADDEHKSGENEACEIKHTINSDILYGILSEYMEVQTLYGVEYDPITTSDGLYHAELNQDIINGINSGVALINYIGHGDQKTLSAEKIIDMERDLNQIYVDSNKMGLWIVGTCKFGQYDNEDCMAEELIVHENASIGVISTVRSVSSNYNIDFLEYLFNEYTNHFNSNDIIRIGDIIKNTKETSYNNNAIFYQGYLFHLFGDPALPIFSSRQEQNYNFPTDINVGEINTIDIMEYDYANMNIKFNDYDSGIYFYGDPTISCDGELNYTIPGASIFKDDFITNSCYSIPLDAMNCNDCNLKMRLYYQDNQTYNGISYISEQINLINDLNNLEIIDETGPEITFKNLGFDIYNNSIVPYNPILTINISDTSGINVYNNIGHNLRYWFNDEINSSQINSNEFIYDNACIGSGHINLLVPEEYTEETILHFEAWDNYNNRTIESILLNVSNSNQMDIIIDNFLNLPNPFKENTYFTFQVPNPSLLPIKIKIKIFNLNGKLVKTLENENINQIFNTLQWSGKSDSNEEIPNGTYIVYIDVTSNNGQKQNKKYIITKIK